MASVALFFFLNAAASGYEEQQDMAWILPKWMVNILFLGWFPGFAAAFAGESTLYVVIAQVLTYAVISIALIVIYRMVLSLTEYFHRVDKRSQSE